jgi:hypothetical protein
MVETKRPIVEIIVKQGNGYIWAHKPDNRGLCDQEALPYYITSRDKAREFVRNRYTQKGLDPMSVRITWA